LCVADAAGRAPGPPFRLFEADAADHLQEHFYVQSLY
jgi:hypothetical protein